MTLVSSTRCRASTAGGPAGSAWSSAPRTIFSTNTRIVRDGVNGILVEPGDHAAIDAATRRLQQSPELAARLRGAAVETVRLYDMRFHIDRLSDAYQQLVIASRTGDLDRPAA